MRPRVTKNDDHESVVVPITITRIMRRAMKEHSRRVPGCPRPDEGSISHFAFAAIVEKLERCGLVLRKLDERYQ